MYSEESWKLEDTTLLKSPRLAMKSEKAYSYCLSPDMMQWEHLTSVVFFPKSHNLSLMMGQCQTNQNWGAFYKTSDQYFQKYHSNKTKEKKL